MDIRKPHFLFQRIYPWKTEKLEFMKSIITPQSYVVQNIFCKISLQEKELLQIEEIINTSILDKDIKSLLSRERVKLAISIISLKKELNLSF